MSKHITSFIELSVAMLLFITALGYGLTTTSFTQQGIKQVRFFNQSKDKYLDLQMGLPVDNSWNGSEIIGFLHSDQYGIANVQIDQISLSLPIVDIESIDLSFIHANQRYRMEAVREQTGNIVEIQFERE